MEKILWMNQFEKKYRKYQMKLEKILWMKQFEKKYKKYQMKWKKKSLVQTAYWTS